MGLSLGNLFGKDDSSSKITNSSTTNYTDQSASAGGSGSIAAGAGAVVTINDLSESVANNAINSASKNLEFTTNTLLGLAESAAAENKDTRNSADISLQTAAGLLSALQNSTSSAMAKAQDPNGESVKTILSSLTPIFYVGGAIIAAMFLFSGGKKDKS